MLIEADAQEVFNKVMRVFEIAYSGHKTKRIELQGEFFREAEGLETAFADTLAARALEVCEINKINAYLDKLYITT